MAIQNLNKYISLLGDEFKRNSISDFSGYTQNQKLLFLYAYYHYFNADGSALPQILQGDISKSSFYADKICGIYTDTEADKEDVDAIIPLSVSSETEFNDYIEKIPSILNEAKEAMLLACQGKQSGGRPEIIALLTENGISTFNDENPLKIKIITNYVPQKAKAKIIDNAIQSANDAQDDGPNPQKYVTFQIDYGTDIEYEILEIEDPKECVESSFLETDGNNNALHFGNENSLITNISAHSLKSLYEAYGFRGLFGQNLRYYVKSKKVDSKIVESIQLHPENFWYYNNGIIIICDDFKLEGRVLSMKRFSIINGGQTTKLIGITDFDKDFYLQCKIVKNKYVTESERLQFISDVAEASNTQKPIKPKDLIAGKLEQKLLKKQLLAAGVFCSIKRGDKVNKKIYKEPWQNTTNEQLGQLLMSAIYQAPGIARSNKASICGNKARYTMLFGPISPESSYDTGLLCDLLRLKAQYNSWILDLTKCPDDVDQIKLGLVKNGMYFMIAIIGALIKLHSRPELAVTIMNLAGGPEKCELISHYDISHPLFNPVVFSGNDSAKSLYDLFEYCYKNFLRPGWDYLKYFKPNFSSYSNFTKVDKNYKYYVLSQMWNRLNLVKTFSTDETLKYYFYPLTDEDRQKDRSLLVKFMDVATALVPTTEHVVAKATQTALLDALQDFRTQTYKQEHVRAYEVFTNKARSTIAKFAPTSLDDLAALNCLSDEQIDKYGDAIIELIENTVQG